MYVCRYAFIYLYNRRIESKHSCTAIMYVCMRAICNFAITIFRLSQDKKKEKAEFNSIMGELRVVRDDPNMSGKYPRHTVTCRTKTSACGYYLSY